METLYKMEEKSNTDVVNKLKNRKCTKPGGISNELLKYGGSV